MAEARSFQMHQALLWDVITRQAGDLHKAVIEAVQNSIDSGSKSCTVIVDQDRIVISDDGKGFQDMSEVENFFETFGFPHEKDDAVFGRFRMGRGQLFSFGRNEWRTRKYKFSIDIKPQEGAKSSGLGYTLEKDLEDTPGCNIEIHLYDALKREDVDKIERELRDMVKYVQIPVILNGQEVAKRPETQKWTEETDEAWFKFTADKTTLDVYNQGILVRKYPASDFGIGGAIVSKTKLDVNFARNDVIKSCPIWKACQKVIRRHSDDGMSKKKSALTVSERERLFRDVTGRSIPFDDLKDLRFIETVTGSFISISELSSRISANRYKLAFAEPKNLFGDKAMQSKLALVLSRTNLEKMGASTPEEFVATLQRYLTTQERTSQRSWEPGNIHSVLDRVEHITMADLIKVIGANGYKSVPEKELTKGERVALRLLSKINGAVAHNLQKLATVSYVNQAENLEPHRAAYYLRGTSSISGDLPDRFAARLGERFEEAAKAANTRYGHFPTYNIVPVRRMMVGESPVAHAWTNGTDTIWMNRNLLRRVAEGYGGIAALTTIVLHEYMHDTPDTETHAHDEDFYKMFHDISIFTSVIGDSVAAVVAEATRAVRNEGKKPTGAFKYIESREEELKGMLLPIDPDEKIYREQMVLDLGENSPAAYIEPVAESAPRM